MKQRIITAICLIAVALPCVILGGYFFKGFIAVALIAAVYEMLRICTRPKVKLYIYPLVALFFVYGFLFDQNDLFLASYGILLYLVVLFTATIFDDTLTIERTSYIFTMGVLICSGLHALMALRDIYGFEYLLLLALATYGSDTGAYFTGVTIGKHASYLGIIETNRILIVACFVLTITGQVGDLVFSAIKRHFGVKDYSNLLPGHGGVLDRIDSILFNALVLSFFLVMVRV